MTIAGQAGNVTTPPQGDVRSGVSYGSAGNEKTGTFTLPAASKVQSAVKYGRGGTQFTGTFTEPGSRNVRQGVRYGGAGTEFTGSFNVPAASNVVTGVTYGSGAEFTGTAQPETHVDCTVDGSQGCVANNTFFAARTCTGNRDDDCFIHSASAYDAANLSNLTAGNIKSGVTIAGQAGSLTLPAASDVLLGVKYGTSGNERTGNFRAPATSNVRTSTSYGANGNQYTGTFAAPHVSDVEAGVRYGAGGTEYTGSFVVPARSNVIAGVTYGNASEFTGSAPPETHTNCSGANQSGCVATTTYATMNKSSAGSRTGLTSGNFDAAIATPSIYEFWDASGNRHTISGDSDLVSGNVRSGTEIHGVTGNVTASPSNCSGANQSGCVATSTYRTMNLSSAGSNTGLTFSNFSSSIATNAVFEFWDASGNRHTITGDSDLRASKIRSGVNIHGVNGNVVESPVNCSGANQSGCIATNTYKTMNLSAAGSHAALTASNFDASISSNANYEFWDASGNRHSITGDSHLTAGNIKNLVEVHGVIGGYPSSSYPLPSASGTSDLHSSTFQNQVKSSTGFEYWTSAGSYQTGAGDSDISAGNLVSGVDIFGTVGTQSTGTPTPNCALLPDSWVYVEGDIDYDTPDFCIMKYEAKNVSNSPASNATNTPWVSISQQDAKTECASLGRGFELISNDQWMTVAANIAENAGNWCNSAGGNCGAQGQSISPGAVSSGSLIINRGHTDRSINTACDARYDNVRDDCAIQSPSKAFLTKRTHRLLDGGVVWDLSGNVWDLTSYYNEIYKPNANGGYGSYSTLTGSAKMPLSDLIPTSTVKSYWDDTWSSNQGIGEYYEGPAGTGALWRGGYYSSSEAGIFGSWMGFDATFTSAEVGFRCVSRPFAWPQPKRQ